MGKVSFSVTATQGAGKNKETSGKVKNQQQEQKTQHDLKKNGTKDWTKTRIRGRLSQAEKHR